MQFLKNKKAQSVGDIPVYVLALVVSAIVGALGQQIVGDVGSSMTANSYEKNGTTYGQEGINKLLSKLGIIGTVLAAVIVIGLLVRNFRLGQQ